MLCATRCSTPCPSTATTCATGCSRVSREAQRIAAQQQFPQCHRLEWTGSAFLLPQSRVLTVLVLSHAWNSCACRLLQVRDLPEQGVDQALPIARHVLGAQGSLGRALLPGAPDGESIRRCVILHEWRRFLTMGDHPTRDPGGFLARRTPL